MKENRTQTTLSADAARRAILEGQDNPFLCRNCDRGGEEVWRFAE